MEASQVFGSNQYAAPSQDGLFIASLTAQHLYVQHATSLAPAYTFPLDTAPTSPDPSTTATAAATGRPAFSSHARNVTTKARSGGTGPASTAGSTPAVLTSSSSQEGVPSIHWSRTSTHILLLSSQAVQVFSLREPGKKTRISNGSGGLGRIVAAEILTSPSVSSTSNASNAAPSGGTPEVPAETASHVMVVWEFGRVGVWDLSSGREAELGDVKTGLAASGTGTGKAWAARPASTQGGASVLALLSRTSAADHLTLFLPPFTTPFKTTALSTIDAQSVSWSPCGRWLAVLDSPLHAPSVHMLTADGHAFRCYPPNTPLTPPLTPSSSAPLSGSDPFGLGAKTLSWSPAGLALGSSCEAGITVLDPRTFSVLTNLSYAPRTDEAAHAYQEHVSAAGVRSYTFLAGAGVPRAVAATAKASSIADLRFNATGSLLAARDESAPAQVLVWRLGRRAPWLVLLLHSAVRRMAWHPSRMGLLVLVGEDGCVQICDVAEAGEQQMPPVFVSHPFLGALGPAMGSGKVDAKWLAAAPSQGGQDGGGAITEEQSTAILVSTRKSGWAVVWPEGRPDVRDGLESSVLDVRPDDASEDSLYDILTGRTPLPELGSGKVLMPEDENSTKLEDTFREKKALVGDVTDPDIF